MSILLTCLYIYDIVLCSRLRNDPLPSKKPLKRRTKMEMITYKVLGIEFSMPKSEIEKMILAMSVEKFCEYARQFIPNKYHPCAFYAEPAWFKSREEWEKYEIEGDGHRLIRRETLEWECVKLYWRLTSLQCLVQFLRRPSG